MAPEVQLSPRRLQALDWLVLACRLAVGATLVWASVDKVMHPGAFAQDIHNYRLLPADLLHPFALVLPMVELVTGVALVLGFVRRGAALISALLMAIFIAAIGSALARGLDISCGCFNTEGGHTVGLDLIWRDALLLAASVIVLVAAHDRLSLGAMRRRRD